MTVREATASDITALFQTLEQYEPVVQVPRRHVRGLRSSNTRRGPAASLTAGPRSGLPQPDEPDANTHSDPHVSAWRLLHQDVG